MEHLKYCLKEILIAKSFLNIKNSTFLKRNIPFAVYEIGIVTLPIKYRPGNFERKIPNNVYTDINLGTYIGRKWGRQRFYYDKNKNHESAALMAAIIFSPVKIDLSKRSCERYH